MRERGGGQTETKRDTYYGNKGVMKLFYMPIRKAACSLRVAKWRALEEGEAAIVETRVARERKL